MTKDYFETLMRVRETLLQNLEPAVLSEMMADLDYLTGLPKSKSELDGYFGEMLARMPDVLHDIALIAGVRPALALSRHYGGTRIYFPLITDPLAVRSRLAKIIGIGPLTLLAGSPMFGGRRLEIPHGTHWHSYARKCEIVRLTNAGWTTGRIARSFGLTQRYVRMIRAEHREGIFAVEPDDGPKQLSLF